MTRWSEGRSLELYFIDGKPDGMLTAEMFNWTGHVLMSPRTRISAALARREAGYRGVYILLGENDRGPVAYIGESENVNERISSHDARKDWWSSAVLVTTSGNKLDKAHVKYLEARLVEEARKVGATELDNGSTPPRPGLSEAGQANMESFLANLFMILPVLRVDMFVRNTRSLVATALPIVKNVAFELNSKTHGVSAKAVLEQNEFIVEAGSTARLHWQKPGAINAYARLHAELKERGVLTQEGDRCVFSENYAFPSPVAAASVVCGRPAAGTIEWKLKGTDITYKEWEAAQLASTGERVG